MPVGFKNGTDGNVRIAVDGVISARHPHCFLGVTEQGLAAIVATRGNPDCHVILRGGSKAPNYDVESIRSATETLGAAKLSPRLMVDASHGNSGKDFRKQPGVLRELASRIEAGDRSVFGVMLESFLAEGRQDIPAAAKEDVRKQLAYGQSVTDACLGWEETERVLEELARSVGKSRSKKK